MVAYSWPLTMQPRPIQKLCPDTTTLYRVIGRDDYDCFRYRYVHVLLFTHTLVEAGKDQTIMGQFCNPESRPFQGCEQYVLDARKMVELF